MDLPESMSVSPGHPVEPSVDPSAGPVRARWVRDFDDLARQIPDWDGLLARSETQTPFMTWSGLTAWWQTFGRDQALWAVVVEDARGICAVAPLARARRALGPLPYRVLEIIGTGGIWGIGTGLSDRTDLLLARRREESLQAIIDCLITHRRHWDVVNLRGLPEQSTSAQALDRLSRSRQRPHLTVLGVPRWRSPFLPLEGDFSDYLRRRGRNFRKTLKRKRRRLEALGPLTLDLNAGVDDPQRALQIAADVCRRSWKGQLGSGLLVQPAARRFVERLVCDPRANTFIATLRVGERVAAYELGFRFDGKLWSYDSSFDPAFYDASPGVYLTARIIEDAYERGLREYDFMRGDEPYKLQWHGACRQEVELVMDTGSLRGQAIRALAFEARWRLRHNERLVALKTRATGALTRLMSTAASVRPQR